MYGAILNSYGDKDGAIEKYKIAYNLNPYNVINIVRLATFYFNKFNLETSKNFLEDAFKYAWKDESLEAAYKELKAYYIQIDDKEKVDIY